MRPTKKRSTCSEVVRRMAASNCSTTEIRASLNPLYGRDTVDQAILRARASGHMARYAPKRRPNLLTIALPMKAALRLAERAQEEDMRPSQLARIILQRASRNLDMLDLCIGAETDLEERT